MNTMKRYDINYVLNQLGKRILPQYFYEMNPRMMSTWQNQICRQAHVIACYYLYQWLGDDYHVQFYESIFIDSHTNNKYDHSWCFITNKTDPDDNYLCDIARVSEHIGFIRSRENDPSRYISDDEIVSERKTFDWKQMIKDKEYYTGKRGLDIIEDIDKRLIECRLSIV
jgi:hypothetical protein